MNKKRGASYITTHLPICFIPLLENDAVAAINELIRQFDTLKMIYGRLRKVVEEW